MINVNLLKTRVSVEDQSFVIVLLIVSTDLKTQKELLLGATSACREDR